jgi:hypothetical protein
MANVERSSPLVAGARWLAVLPAALFAMLVIGLLFGLLRPILVVLAGAELPSKSSTIFDATVDVGAGSTTVSLAKVGIQAFAFVFVGALVAPSSKYGTSVILAALYTVIVVGLMGLVLVSGWGSLNAMQILATIGLMGSSLVGAVVAVTTTEKSS